MQVRKTHTLTQKKRKSVIRPSRIEVQKVVEKSLKNSIGWFKSPPKKSERERERK